MFQSDCLPKGTRHRTARVVLGGTDEEGCFVTASVDTIASAAEDDPKVQQER